MKKFTKAEINGARTSFEKGFEKVSVTLGERDFSYFVLPQSLEEKLPDFVIRCTGEPSDGYVLGISDSVDERFRQYAVAHEYIEFTEIGIDAPDRCVRALEEELKLVPDNIKPDYIPMRRDFFAQLIQYCSSQPELYTSADIAEFQKTLTRLEELVN